MTKDAPPEKTGSRRVIRQLVLSTNFGAVFLDEDGDEPWVDTIVAWALVANESYDRTNLTEAVVGLVADGKDIVFVDEFPNFAGYLSPDSSLDEWRKRLKADAESDGRSPDDSVVTPRPRGRW